ncbi:DsbE family thiol:disulfide interchange protein [Candidatus Pelagibacter sp.]|nr:DsbE family thiol:disulfide interchange protein [Candidatus Pelagibacter sp.]
MKSKFFPLILILVFLITFVIFFKGLKSSNIYIPNTNLQKKIPSFELKSFENNSIIISEKIFKDNGYYLMNIWASWCIPCRDEHKILMELKQNEKIKLIGFNYKDNFKNALNFLKDLGNPYDTIVSDKDGTAAIEWGAYGVPESFLVYQNKIIKRFIGPIKNKDLLEIQKIIR